MTKDTRMPIAFDDAAADVFISAARRAAAELSGQSGRRGRAVATAANGFVGPHARVFRQLCATEMEDRHRLAGVLLDMVEQILEVRAVAELERNREQATAEWYARESARTLQRARAETGGKREQGFNTTLVYDPKPEERSMAAPPIWGSFSARVRARGGTGAAGERSGAVPAALGSFVSETRLCDLALRRELSGVSVSWTQLVASSPWMRIESASFIPGFHALLTENERDIVWISRIATAFITAGSGTMSAVKLGRIVGTPPRKTSDHELLLRLSLLSESELIALAEVMPGALTQLERIDPSVIAKWWAGMSGATATEYSTQQDLLLRRFPALFGALEGIPAGARVRANRSRAVALMNQARAERKLLGSSAGDAARDEFLRNEMKYLSRVRRGEVKLYLYDREQSRIVEMIGEPGVQTERVITYVPGTFTSMDSFYRGGVQQVGKHLTETIPGTVAFIAKDGLFPGEEQTSRAPKMLRLRESNDTERAREAGEQLAQFARGMRSDPQLSGGDQIGIGYSWGLANLTSSEVAGTKYNTVISLSGAGMIPEWEADPRTGYFDLSYPDLLQGAQRQGYAWRGSSPRAHPRFTNMPYYRGPEDDVLESNSLNDFGKKVDVLIKNHNLIATESQDNQRVLEDLRRLAGA